jgi:hypothetical protein
MKIINATVIRTAMIGGGTSYDVYFLKTDKPSHPLHNSHIYATVIMRDDREFFKVVDAIDPQSHWKMEPGMKKCDQFKKLEAIAKRLAVRIAKRAFPELRGLRELPSLWASWNMPTTEKTIPVHLALPV